LKNVFIFLKIKHQKLLRKKFLEKNNPKFIVIFM